MSDLFNEPDAGGYDVIVVWPEGQRTLYVGAKLTAAEIADGLESTAAEIRATIAAEQVPA